MPTIPYYDWIAHHAGRRPTRLAIHDLQTNRKFTYADLDARTDRLTAALAAMGIGKGDHEKSKAYRARNYEFFGAPAGLVFTIDRKLEKGSWLDYGMFLQTLMLAARARGLHTCPEASIASYPDVVRRELGISRDWVVICGMALGYADERDVVNTFQPERIALEDYATFMD